MGAKLRRIFIAGIFTAIPVYITIVVLQFLFRFMDRILAPVVQGFIGVHIPGLGLVLMIISLFILGLFVTNFLGRAVYHSIEKVVLRIPIVSSVYNTTKQIVQTFSPDQRKALKKVVWVEYPRKGLWTLGFVTGTCKSADGVSYYNIFVATTPNPTSGYVVFIPQEDCLDAHLSIEEGFKLLISAGALSRDSYHFLHRLPAGPARLDRAEPKTVARLPAKTGPSKAASKTRKPAAGKRASKPAGTSGRGSR